MSASDWTYCTSFPDDTSPENDWGHIELPTSPGRGYFSLSTSVSRSDTITLCGYPADKSVADIDGSIDGFLYYMYKMSGNAEVVNSDVLYYSIDMTGGQSGSPIYNNSNIVVGINCQHKDKDSNNLNRGCKITQYMINAFSTYGWCQLEQE